MSAVLNRGRKPELTERLVNERNGAGLEAGAPPERSGIRLGRWFTGIIGTTAAAIGISHAYDAGPAPALEPPPPVSQELAIEQYSPPTPQIDPSPALDQLLPDDIRNEAATHESGHVQALREFGIPVMHVSIGDDGSGETQYPDHYHRDFTRDAYDNAIVDAAGQESAAAWLEQIRGYTHERALAETAQAARSDLAQLRIDAGSAGITTEQAHERARQIVHDHQADINHTAHELIDHGGYLDGHNIEPASAIEPTPTPAPTPPAAQEKQFMEQWCRAQKAHWEQAGTEFRSCYGPDGHDYSPDIAREDHDHELER